MTTNFSNSTGGAETEDERQTITAITTVYIAMGLLGVLGNGLVLFVIAVVRDLHDVANILIANQSLIDLLTSFLLLTSFVAPLPPLPHDNQTLGRFLCAFWHSKFPFWSLIVASSLNLTLMTLERYYAIVFPIHYHSRTTSAKFNFLVALPWVSGFAYQQYLAWFTKVEQNQCLLFLFPNEATRTGLAFGGVFLEFVIPIAVMLFVYITIAIKLKKSAEERFNQKSRQNRDSQSNDFPRRNADSTDHRRTARRNVIKVMLTVSILFTICWTPNMLIYMAYCFGYDLDFDGLMYTLSVFIAFGNMWVNPFIYCFQYRRFQKGLRKVFCRWAEDNNSSKQSTGVFQTLSATV